MVALHVKYSCLFLTSVIRIYWIYPIFARLHLCHFPPCFLRSISNFPTCIRFLVLFAHACNLTPAQPLYPNSLLLLPFRYQLKGNFFHKAFSDYLHLPRRSKLCLLAVHSCTALHLSFIILKSLITTKDCLQLQAEAPQGRHHIYLVRGCIPITQHIGEAQ